MTTYSAHIDWQRQGEAFTDNRYSRVHRWQFDGGLTVPASPSPFSVRPPFSDPANIDPEEAFVAAAASCHMLCFLYLAARDGYVVDSYQDAAEGVLEASEPGGPRWITRITLRPHVVFSGSKSPTDAILADLHARAHHDCFIAHSMRGEVVTAGSWEYRENGAGGGN